GWRVVQLGLARTGEPPVGRRKGVVYVRFNRGRYRGRNLIRYLWSYLGFFVWARSVIARVRKRDGISVVHANNIPNFVVWVTRPARRGGAGVIFDIHDPVPELFLCKYARFPGAKVVAHCLQLEERTWSRLANVVVSVHEPHRELCEQHGIDPRKLRVVLNAADGDLFPFGPPRHPTPLVAYYGTVTARMGLDVVLHALHELRRRDLPMRGAIWGDGDVVDELRVLRDQLDLADSVEIPGVRVPFEELLPRLGTVGIAIAPVRRDVFTDYLLPTKLIEAVRLGIPSVVTWTPTVARYFPDDSVYYLRDFTPSGVAQGLANVLRYPEEARARATRAQRLP